ncbi:MAG: DUF2079 domain-containing protein [Clostridia bacterium]|nr:DUF2079 domain-containing protein [Clostridia bacterium]
MKKFNFESLWGVLSIQILDILCSALISWLFMNIITGSFAHSDDINHTSDVSIPASVLIFAVLFAASVILTIGFRFYYRVAVSFALIFTAAAYSCAERNSLLSVGLAGLILLLLYAGRGTIWQRLWDKLRICGISPRHAAAAYIIFGVLLALFIGVVTVYRYLAFKTSTFDFGIFTQMFESMKNTGSMTTTVERNEAISHFDVHISPIYYLLLPFYCLFPSPITLQIAQAVIVAASLIPLYLLCRHFGLHPIAVILTGAAFIMYPALSGSCFYDIHENCFLTVLLLTLIWCVETGHNKSAVITALALWCVKEDAGIYTAFLGLYFFASGRHKKAGWLIFIWSCLAFVISTSLLSGSENEVMSQRFSNLVTSEDSDNLYGVIKTVWTHAAYLISECITEEKLLYLALMLLPFAPVIFSKKDPTSFILMGPMILLNVLPDYVYMHTINYQYNFGNTALLFYFFILAVKDKDSRDLLRDSSAAVAVCLVLFCGTKLYRAEVVSQYYDREEIYEEMAEALDSIPKDASVTASGFLTSHLYDHEELYPTTSKKDSDYLALDLTRDETDAEKSMLESGKYELWYMRENVIAIYKYTGD